MRGYAPDCWKMIPALAAIALLGLSGCSETPQKPQVSQTTTQAPVRQNNSDLFRQANAAIEKGEFVNARQLLQQLQQKQLSDKERIDWLLMAGVLELGTGNSEAANAYLNDLSRLRNRATTSQDGRISLLKAAWYEQRSEYFAALRERVFIAPMLKDQLYHNNHSAIWQDIQNMPTADVSDKAEQNRGTVLGQWLELAMISRTGMLSLDDQLAAIHNWQQRNPSHPAALQLPGSLTYLAQVQRPAKIAVALPLSGPLERSGQAIRDGILAGYYDALNKSHDVPELIILDSQAYADINAVYADALMNGASWLIGPVNKPEVQALENRQQLPLPTLALNYGDFGGAADEQPRPANLFEFGLAPEDEAIQIAEKAWADGHRYALAMAPQDAWGERIYASFKEHWLALGGEISETRFYQNRNDYNPDVRALLNIDESQQRANLMRQVLQQKAEYEPRRRTDADWIFLVAQPQQARQINPTLAFNFAADLPVYATSHLYSGIPDINNDRDLNGIRFCDLPWLLEPGELYQTVEANTPSGQGRYVRLYALGVDAFQLVPRLPQMQAFASSRISGATGTLMLDPQQRVRRQAECAIFKSGSPVVLTDVR
jgi:uncharacterized protein